MASTIRSVDIRAILRLRELRWLLLSLVWFAGGAVALAFASGYWPGAMARNAERWHRMGPAERHQILKHYREFQQLPPAERRAIRDLAAYIFSGPPNIRESRLAIAREYAHWKRELPLDLQRRLDAAGPAELSAVLREVYSEWQLRRGRRPYWFALFGPPIGIDNLSPEELARLDEELPLQRMFLLGNRRPGNPPDGAPPPFRFFLERLSPQEREEAQQLLEQLREIFDRNRDRDGEPPFRPSPGNNGRQPQFPSVGR